MLRFFISTSMVCGILFGFFSLFGSIMYSKCTQLRVALVVSRCFFLFLLLSAREETKNCDWSVLVHALPRTKKALIVLFSLDSRADRIASAEVKKQKLHALKYKIDWTDANYEVNVIELKLFDFNFDTILSRFDQNLSKIQSKLLSRLNEKLKNKVSDIATRNFFFFAWKYKLCN